MEDFTSKEQRRLWLKKIVVEGLRTAIRAHGPIEYHNMESAAKRISHQIEGQIWSDNPPQTIEIERDFVPREQR